MRQIRTRLREENQTFRDAVIQGLRATLLASTATTEAYCPPDEAFEGEIGFASGFGANDLTRAIHQDGAARFPAS